MSVDLYAKFNKKSYKISMDPYPKFSTIQLIESHKLDAKISTS